VVLPWSIWPIVPMFTWGFVRSNFFFDMPSSEGVSRASDGRSVAAGGIEPPTQRL
jgi:hypothetical protein